MPTGGPIFKEVATAYLTGYCAGVRAPRAHRFPLAGDQQFKRLLGQYLAERITVYHPNSGRYGLLRGLPYCAQGDGEPFADVEFYADAEAREEGGGDLVEPYGKILPVLYGFDDLATELLLPDGRRVVPACELANMVREESGYKSPAVKASICGEVGDQIVFIESAYGTLLSEFTDKCLAEGRLAGRTEQLLRSLHFAVGLAPHQYHRRVAGFDYAAGGRPECAGCERKEVCRG